MKVLQILPELNSGGVERGTLEIAEYLIANGHQAIVVSNGGRQVPALEALGARHIAMPVHRKRLSALAQISKFRALLELEKPDILHLRSRLPAWIAWMAWRSMAPRSRPRLITTVHGFYSINPYSAIMTKGENVIAVSNSVREYVLKNYPTAAPEAVHTIHRGVDPNAYPVGYQPSPDWLATWKTQNPMLEGRIPLLLPARLTRWKGQEHFIQLVSRLISLGHPVHGLIVGETHPKKVAFLDELRNLTSQLKVSEHISFLGHRSDLKEIMAVSKLVYSLSLDPEAFGRVSLEAMALGKPCIAYNHGGVAEQLQAIFPEGLVPAGNVEAAIKTSLSLLKNPTSPAGIGEFTLQRMQKSTLQLYQSLAARH